jgi:hypothetical protein
MISSVSFFVVEISMRFLFCTFVSYLYYPDVQYYLDWLDGARNKNGRLWETLPDFRAGGSS